MEVDDGPDPKLNYVVSAHKPTRVEQAAVCSFTGKDDTNLVLTMSNRLEVHTVREGGLQLIKSVSVSGVPLCVKAMRLQGQDRDILVVLLEKWWLCLLAWNPDTGEIDTVASRNTEDPVCKAAPTGPFLAVDSLAGLVAVHAFQTRIKIVSIIAGEGGAGAAFSDAADYRTEELNIVDLTFLARDPSARPAIAVLTEDQTQDRHLRTLTVNQVDVVLEQGPIKHVDNVELGSRRVVALPEPVGGVLVVGERTALYVARDGAQQVHPLPPGFQRAVGVVDAKVERVLLSDETGRLAMLALQQNGSAVVGMQLESLGSCSPASNIAYLGDGLAFLGSMHTDSQLVKIHAEPQPGGAGLVEVLETYKQLGPMVDMVVVDLDRQGQGQVVACCGMGRFGSLRVVRSGIGITEHVSAELPGVRGAWSLGADWGAEEHSHLIVALTGQTVALAVTEGGGIEQVEAPGIDAAAQAIHVGNVRHGQAVVATRDGVALLSAAGLTKAAEWRPDGGAAVTLAASNCCQVAAGFGGSHVAVLEVAAGGLTAAKVVDVGSQVACLDCTPLGEDASGPCEYVAVGTWDNSVLLLRAGAGEVALTVPLGAGTAARSVLLTRMVGQPHMMVGTGDGHIVMMELDVGGAAPRALPAKSVAIGTRPVGLRALHTAGMPCVFATGDRPAVAYANNGKIVLSNVNDSDVTGVAPFSSPQYPGALVVTKDDGLTVGTVDEIQKLHVQTVPLGCQGRRIAHDPASHTYCVAALPDAERDTTGELILLEDQLFEERHRVRLCPQEDAQSLVLCRFDGESAPFYCVGTAVIDSAEEEPKQGRIAVYCVEGGKLEEVCDKQAAGAVYALEPFEGRLLVTINNKVFVMGLKRGADGKPELEPICGFTGQVLSLYLAHRGDFVLMADLMRSVTLLTYQRDPPKLTERAQDYQMAWPMAISILDDSTFAMADSYSNITVLAKSDDDAVDEVRQQLQIVGEMHVGQNINRFCAGSLTMRTPDSPLGDAPSQLFCTVQGAIGLMVPLSRKHYDLLSALQLVLQDRVQPVGGMPHSIFRSVFSETGRRRTAMVGMVDGDIVEMLLDMPRAQQEEVVRAMSAKTDVDSVVALVEELARLH
ncbi:unnamed protein product [Pedinophyceae sp. YPF-701]|nr:unnamed protein product [Pedinophyceae sp. YPF-701]